MKKLYSIFILVLILLYSCDMDFYEGKRPIDYINSEWICEEYGMFFSVNENKIVEEATIYIDNEKYAFEFLWSSLDEGVSIYIIKDNKSDNWFHGHCEFGSKKFVIKADDSKGYFDEKSVTLVFTRTK